MTPERMGQVVEILRAHGHTALTGELVRHFDQGEREWREERNGIAIRILEGLIASPPVVDRTRVDSAHWSRIALRWADVFLEVGLEDPATLQAAIDAQRERDGRRPAKRRRSK